MALSRTLFRAALAAALGTLFSTALLASCGSAMCPMDPQSLNLPLPRQFTLDFSFQYIDQDQVRVGRREGAVGEIPSNHEEVATVNRAAGLLVNYATSNRLVLSAFVFRLALSRAQRRGVRRCFSFSPAGATRRQRNVALRRRGRRSRGRPLRADPEALGDGRHRGPDGKAASDERRR
jgi:hypothetical protein